MKFYPMSISMHKRRMSDSWEWQRNSFPCNLNSFSFENCWYRQT